jgi:hypothetical protein
VHRLPPLLITGETGTGKGLVARIIHRGSSRAKAQFVELNGAAIPEQLLESELFGYERGAFTDAKQSKPGLLHLAHRGTLFLDEVALLPLAMQAKLLKVLEDSSVRRLGATRSEPADLCIISATNEDLAASVRNRRFRGDLYHRLTVITLALPPLRELGNDVDLLAEEALARACAKYSGPAKQLGPDASAALRAYRWPGTLCDGFRGHTVVIRMDGRTIYHAVGVSTDPVTERAGGVDVPAATRTAHVAVSATPGDLVAAFDLDVTTYHHVAISLVGDRTVAFETSTVPFRQGCG